MKRERGQGRGIGSWPIGSRAPSTMQAILPSSGKFVTTQSLHLNVDLRVPRLPKEGLNLQAHSAESSPGGGYVGAVAARAQGVRTLCASPLGTGPNSHAIRRRLALDGLEALPGAIVGDVGVGVSLVEEDGKVASVIAPGVEAETSLDLLASVPIESGDIVLIHGGDLAVSSSAEVLTQWVPTLPEDFKVVIAVSPAVDQVSAEVWIPLLQRADILTMNIREADTIRETLTAGSAGTSIRNVLRKDAAIVRRLGAMGCDLQESSESRTTQVPSFRAEMVDTAGVGDTHVAVMCASLLQGSTLHGACVRANAAGALMVQHPGSYPPPTKHQVDQVIAVKSAAVLA
ncbi:MAG: PfkB family carbohydrate kinase [Scrofimicrobium sp.]